MKKTRANIKKTAKTKILRIQPNNISRTSSWSKITIQILIQTQTNRDYSSGSKNGFFKPEASCPNVGQEWGAKHSTLFKFATRFISFYIFDEYVFSIFENMDTSLLTISKISELQGNLTKIDRENHFAIF